VKLSAWLLIGGLVGLSASCKKKDAEVPELPRVVAPVEEPPKPILDDPEATNPEVKPPTSVEEDMPDEEEPSLPDNEPSQG
jgi:hypothetical protein